MKKGTIVNTIYGSGTFLKYNEYGQAVIALDNCPKEFEDIQKKHGGIHFYKIKSNGLWD